MKIFFADSGCTTSNSNHILSSGNLPQTCANQANLDKIFVILFSIIGALVVLFFVIAGLRYILSGGDPDDIKRAKNEMKYAVIGLIIVALAWTIVKFVVDRLT